MNDVDIRPIWKHSCDNRERATKKYSFLSKFEMNRRTEEVWRHIDIKKGERCLDVGCGQGAMSVGMALAGGIVSAFDINPDYIKELERFSSGYGVKIDSKVLSALSVLPYPKESFDFILSVEVFEHLSDPREGLLNAAKYLKPDGRIVLTVPNSDSLFWRIVHFSEKAGLWKHRETIGRQTHVEFPKKKAFELVKDFDIIEYRPLFSSHLFVLKPKTARINR